MAADRGLCLSADRGVITTYQASILDAQLRPTRSFPLPGIPSRTRVSPDGRLGALTVFVSGHSYAAFGFSTETRIVDLTSGESLGNLEELAVWKGGRRFQAVDFNFWGVTFAGDGNRFYATLGAGDERYLVTGDAARREMRVLRANVECPSLSPDNRRLVYKKRLSGFGPVRWRLHALDLETMDETPLAETRSVDDQVEWLDDHRVLYALPEEQPSAATNVWVAPADGSADPQLLIRGAASPTVARPAGVLSGPR